MTSSLIFRVSCLALAPALLVASACAGSGPHGDGTDPPEQDLPLRQEQQATNDTSQHAGSDYQRPLIDSQNVTLNDKQTLPGVSAELALGNVSGADICDEICDAVTNIGCGGGCRQQCNEWRDAPAACLQVVKRLADCIVQSDGSCEDAVVACSLELASAAEGCDFEELDQQF